MILVYTEWLSNLPPWVLILVYTPDARLYKRQIDFVLIKIYRGEHGQQNYMGFKYAIL